MKKVLSLVLTLAMLLSMTAFAQAEATTTINLWTFPVWSNDGSFETELIAAFEAANPGIKVQLTTIDYQAGDDKLNAAIEAGTGPDVLFETPQRINKYGANGKLIALDDLFTDELKADIMNQAILPNLGNNGHMWTYPESITAHCMAINLDQWTESGAIEYVNLEGDRTWTTDNFVKACEKLTAAGYMSAVIYCGGQGGDQGTRALVSNLYSASFANADHTEWTIGSEQGAKALQLLKDMVDKGTISYDAGIVAGDELQLFANGTVATTLCWNAINERNYASQVTFKAVALPFPSDDGTPVLEGGLYGFGIFDNGDAARADAAKKFVEFACHDTEWGPKAVKQTGIFPVYASIGDVYADSDNDQLPAFAAFTNYLGDMFNVMPSFTEQRPEWWGMLQYIFSGEKTVEAALADYTTACNAAQAAYNK
jgi:multiple sugar transport system substrate-binding protein